MGWAVALGLLLVAFLPLGVSVSYNSRGTVAKLILGPVKLTVYPSSKKDTVKTKKKSKDKPAAEPMPEKPSIPPKKEQTKETGGSWKDFLPLVRTGLDFLGDFRRKLRVNRLELKLILAGDDPCDLAVNYGRAWTAVGNLMPRLERLFVIKKRNVEVECDFMTTETLVIARLDLTVTLGRLVGLAVRYGVRVLRELIQIKNKRKGGANQ